VIPDRPVKGARKQPAPPPPTPEPPLTTPAPTLKSA
jgi:hypothetical protein